MKSSIGFVTTISMREECHNFGKQTTSQLRQVLLEEGRSAEELVARVRELVLVGGARLLQTGGDGKQELLQETAENAERGGG
jgi:hypothetical protein